MPFVSDNQRKWMYANEPAMARRFEKETPPGKLPKKKYYKKDAVSMAKGMA